MIGYLITTGIGVWGLQRPGGLGLGDRQLRLLGRHRPRRHPDLGDPLPAAAALAHQHQPLCRGDDHLRRGLRRDLPGHPRRPDLAGLLAVPDSQPDGDVAELPVAAAVGRVRGRHLRHGVAALLVHGHDPRSGHPARPGDDQDPLLHLRHSRASAGARPTGTGTVSSSPTCCSPPWRRRWCCRCTRW